MDAPSLLANTDPTIELELPDDRTYETDEETAVDEALVRAIRAAEDADNYSLAQVLRSELHSFYLARVDQ